LGGGVLRPADRGIGKAKFVKGPPFISPEGYTPVRVGRRPPVDCFPQHLDRQFEIAKSGFSNAEPIKGVSPELFGGRREREFDLFLNLKDIELRIRVAACPEARIGQQGQFAEFVRNTFKRDAFGFCLRRCFSDG